MLDLNQERDLFLIVANSGIDKLAGRAVRRPVYSDEQAEETVADVEGALQLQQFDIVDGHRWSWGIDGGKRRVR